MDNYGLFADGQRSAENVLGVSVRHCVVRLVGGEGEGVGRV